MKKIITAIILAMFLFVGNAYAIPEQIVDAKSLTIYMRQNFEYHEDYVKTGYWEYFQLPGILEFSQVGDCDDFAIYSAYMLRSLGYEAYLLTTLLYYDDEYVGHAITIFKDEDDTYSIFTNQYLINTDKTDPIEAIKDLYKDKWVYIDLWTPTQFGNISYEDATKEMTRMATDLGRYIIFVKYLSIEGLKNLFNYEK